MISRFLPSNCVTGEGVRALGVVGRAHGSELGLEEGLALVACPWQKEEHDRSVDWHGYPSHRARAQAVRVVVEGEGQGHRCGRTGSRDRLDSRGLGGC